MNETYTRKNMFAVQVNFVLLTIFYVIIIIIVISSYIFILLWQQYFFYEFKKMMAVSYSIPINLWMFSRLDKQNATNKLVFFFQIDQK